MTRAAAPSRRRSERGATVVEYVLTATVGTVIGLGGLAAMQPVLAAVFERGACDTASGYECEVP